MAFTQTPFRRFLKTA